MKWVPEGDRLLGWGGPWLVLRSGAMGQLQSGKALPRTVLAPSHWAGPGQAERAVKAVEHQQEHWHGLLK